MSKAKENLKPSKKVTVGAAVGASVILLVEVLGAFGVGVSATAATAVQTLTVFGLQWWTSDA